MPALATSTPNIDMCMQLLLQRQYGRLQCLSSVGLLFRIYMVCVPPTASHGCELWGHCKLQTATAASREALAKSHLHILRHISGVRSSIAVSILLAEFGLMCLPDQWLLRAATFWNALAGLQPGSTYKQVARMPALGPQVCPAQSGVQGRSVYQAG